MNGLERLEVNLSKATEVEEKNPKERGFVRETSRIFVCVN